jgi:hypothetical protein
MNGEGLSPKELYRRRVAQRNLLLLARAWEVGGEEAFDHMWEKLFAHKRTEVTPMREFWSGGETDTTPR